MLGCSPKENGYPEQILIRVPVIVFTDSYSERRKILLRKHPIIFLLLSEPRQIPTC